MNDLCVVCNVPASQPSVVVTEPWMQKKVSSFTCSVAAFVLLYTTLFPSFFPPSLSFSFPLSSPLSSFLPSPLSPSLLSLSLSSLHLPLFLSFTCSPSPLSSLPPSLSPSPFLPQPSSALGSVDKFDRENVDSGVSNGLEATRALQVRVWVGGCGVRGSSVCHVC